MGHMKKLMVLVASLFVFAGVASAHEGALDLSGSGVSCKGISLYQDGYYRVFGRCDGLVYPHETTYNKYVLWAKTSANASVIRIAEVDKGYFSGNIASPYDEVFISAEAESLVRKPSNKLVVTGKVDYFDFDKSKVAAVPTASTAPTAKTSGMTVQNTTSTTSTTAGTVIGKILTSLLVIVLVIVGIAIGASLIFRSRGSVSHS